jgi:hypothetical protein
VELKLGKRVLFWYLTLVRQCFVLVFDSSLSSGRMNAGNSSKKVGSTDDMINLKIEF